MSAIETPSVIPPESLPASPQPAARWLARIEAALVWLGERMNPILVKECRQALKSMQFTITFALLLLLGWGWSILGVALIGPDIYYSFAGPDLFFIYYAVLAFPLIIIVPFVAFRSLAGEVEDRTYELVSITTLKPRQIVGGKLGSAVVQMVVYFSAMAPCLAFTYMLRGLDVVTIGVILFYTFVGSLGLSMLALMIATITSERHWQIVLSVALILGLAWVFIMSLVAAGSALSFMQLAFDDWEFWVVNGGLIVGFISYMALFYLAAAAQLTFATDNRSSALRMVMLIQQLILTGWMTWLCKEVSRQNIGEVPGFMLAYLTIAGIHWFIMGSLMIGESPQLSSRVKRNLPQSFLGRAFLTWFNPGPGTGYAFALLNLFGAVLAVIVGQMVLSFLGLLSGGGPEFSVVFVFATLLFCYVAIYLGVGRLLLMAARRVVQVSLPLSLLLQVLMLLLGCGIPLIIYWMSDMRLTGYSMLHASNPIFTLVHIGDSNTLSLDAPSLLLLLVPLAALTILLNSPSIIAEVRNVRIAKPKRVVEEDAQIEALLHPVQHKPTSPWD